MFDQKPKAYSEFLSLLRPSKRFNLLSLDPYVAEGRLAMPYRYFPGPTATRFFQELRDHQRILGIRCPRCNTVYVPPLSTCGRCFEGLGDWVEVGREGVLQSFTMTHYTLPIHPAPAPLVHGLIRLDGADTALLHLIGESDYASLKTGMRVQAVFKEERAGNILDIRYFRPMGRG